MTAPESVLRLLNLPREADRQDTHPAEHSGKAIVALLEQAAEAARRNEERAKAYAQQLAEQLRSAERRIADLEAQLRAEQARASHAEEWLMHIHDQIKEKLVDPLTNGHGQQRSGRAEAGARESQVRS